MILFSFFFFFVKYRRASIQTEYFLSRRAAKNAFVNSTGISFICESKQRYVYTLSEAWADSCD